MACIAAEGKVSVPHGCVSCSTTSNCKLLRCLHTSCVHCLRENILDSGKVVCPSKGCGAITLLPSSGGVEALTSNYLAACSLPEAEGSHTCDECLQEECPPAVQRCDDCRLLLCEIHVQAHRQGRRTHTHRLTGDVQAWSEPPPVMCVWDQSCKVRSYCRVCERLVCERCITLGTHTGHSVVSLEEAGTFVREQLKMKAEKARV